MLTQYKEGKIRLKSHFMSLGMSIGTMCVNSYSSAKKMPNNLEEIEVSS